MIRSIGPMAMMLTILMFACASSPDALGDHADRLAIAAYRPDVQIEEIATCAERWIKRHRA